MTCIKGQAMSGQHFKPHTGVVQAQTGPKTTQHSLGRRSADRTRRVCQSGSFVDFKTLSNCWNLFL